MMFGRLSVLKGTSTYILNLQWVYREVTPPEVKGDLHLKDVVKSVK